jgi:hypothetical protein
MLKAASTMLRVHVRVKDKQAKLQLAQLCVASGLLDCAATACHHHHHSLSIIVQLHSYKQLTQKQQRH